MINCLLCNEPLIDKSDYEGNKQTFKSPPKFKHKEHIIQNAIGGRLKSDSILCEDCGKILNEEIDANFIKLFAPFTERLKDQLPKERNKNANTFVEGYQLETKRKIVYSNKSVTPKNPSFNINEKEKKILVYANKSVIKHYKSHVLNTLKNECQKFEDYSVEEVTEFEDDENIGLIFSEGVENFNEKWTRGFLKIATEFAYFNEVPKDQLSRTLDIENKKIISTQNLIPFFPVGVIDSFIEWHRIFLERNFPTHTLILFSQSYADGHQELVCYIDLFSTFQYYVLLNDNYKGPHLFKTYCQKLDKQLKPEINFRKIRPKYLKHIAEEQGINFERYEGRNLEELYLFLEKEYAQLSQKYELNLAEELYSTLTNLSTSLVLSQSKQDLSLGQLEEPIKAFKDISDEKRLIIMMELQQFLNTDETINVERYRQVFIEPDGGDGFETLSTPNEIVKEYERNKTMFQNYGKLKFEHLSFFAGKQSKQA